MTNNITSWFRIMFEIVVILLTIPATIISFPGIAVLFSIMALYRQFVISLARLYNKTWMPTSFISGALCVDPYNYEKLSCIAVKAEISKPFDLQACLDKFEPFASSKERPELRSYVRRWMGINFLVPCANYSWSSVVKVNETEDLDEIKRLTDTFYEHPFPRGQPMWRWEVFPNAKGPNVHVVFAFHHALMDGFTLLNMMTHIADPNPEAERQMEKLTEKIKNEFSLLQLSWYSKLLFCLEFVFVTPFFITYSMLKQLTWNNHWTTKRSGIIEQYEQSFSLDELKKIACHVGHNVTTLVYTCVAGAFRAKLIKEGKSVHFDPYIYSAFPSPNVQHNREKITNDVNVIPVIAPISVEDRKERLERVKENFQNLRRPARFLMWRWLSLFGGLFLSLINVYPMLRFAAPYVLTNVIVFGGKQTLMGKSLLNIEGKAGIHFTGLAILISTVTYDDQLLFGIRADKASFPEEGDLPKFVALFQKELNYYAKL